MDVELLLEFFQKSQHKDLAIVFLTLLLWALRELWTIKRRMARSKQVRTAAIMRGLSDKLQTNTEAVLRLTDKIDALEDLDLPQMKEDVARLEERTHIIMSHLAL